MDQPNWQPTKAEHWQHLPAPARPWASEVAWFEKYATEKKAEGKMDVLILGSTVEFRSMLHKLGMNVHVVDFSKDFYNILTETQQDKLVHTGEETFYQENWLALNIDKKFDLIFGDWVPGVLHTNEYDTFFKEVVTHLKDDGLFIGREALRPDNSQVDLEAVVKKHYESYADKYRFYESSMQYVYGYCPDPKTAMWNIAAAKQALLDVKELMTEEDYTEMALALSVEKEASASMMVQADFDRAVSKHFDIVAKHYGTDPSADWYPIYVLQAR